MSPEPTASRSVPIGFPRVSGDEPALTWDRHAWDTFSPRERG